MPLGLGKNKEGNSGKRAEVPFALSLKCLIQDQEPGKHSWNIPSTAKEALCTFCCGSICVVLTKRFPGTRREQKQKSLHDIKVANPRTIS